MCPVLKLNLEIWEFHEYELWLVTCVMMLIPSFAWCWHFHELNCGFDIPLYLIILYMLQMQLLVKIIFDKLSFGTNFF